MEASSFKAYKCTNDGAVSLFATKKLIWTDFVMIDNHFGTAALIGMEGEKMEIVVENSKFYGESPARDCDSKDQCKQGSTGDAVCVDRNAMMLSLFLTGAKDPMPTSSSAVPVSKVKTDSSWGGIINYNGNSYFNYQDTTTFCGNKQKLFALNKKASDYQPMVNFEGNSFQNVAWDNIAMIFSPPQQWANEDDCGNFPCTAPNNVLLKFTRSRLDTLLFSLIRSDSFQIISKNTEAT
jgi:hypothetical protein